MSDSSSRVAAVSSETLGRLYVKENKSIPDIAQELGCSVSTARNRLIEAGISLRSRADGIRAVRSKLGIHSRGIKRNFTPEWRSNMRASAIRRGERTSVGTYLHRGYLIVTRGPDKGRLVHNLVVERRIGRRLKPDEVVHHINGVTTDNADSNLALMTRSDHSRLHRLEDAKCGIERRRNGNGRFC